MADLLPRSSAGAGLLQWNSDFGIREITPHLSGDLVERMEYLYVRVVKARGLKWSGDIDPFAELRLGGYSCTTRHVEKTVSPEWDNVFAFSRERIHAAFLEVFVRGRGVAKEDYVGGTRLDLAILPDAPVSVQPDSAPAPQWYSVFDKKGEHRGEMMMAVWFGTQADKYFDSAVHADAAFAVDDKLAAHIQHKLYAVPRLWYVRVKVVEVREAVFADKARVSEVFVRSRISGQVHRTRTSTDHRWRDEENGHLFVVAEPFEDHLTMSVVGVKNGKEEPEGATKVDKFSSKINVNLCLEGGYKVLSEPVHYLSDVRPSASELRREPIGLVELGIREAVGLAATRKRDGRGSCDAYCVAKYGVKWYRTRTVTDGLSPRFHQTYHWEVHDHCTVLTVAVFHNSQIGDKGGLVAGDPVKDVLLGKVRIRLSTLESGRTYAYAYPLISLHGGGVKKMGELRLAVRFSNSSTLGLLQTYTQPHLPPMHYHRPLTVVQQEMLRREAVTIIAHRLGRMDPPLRLECVEHLCESHALRWSMRRCKAHFFRLKEALEPLSAASTWFYHVCRWTNPVTTIAVHIIFAMLVCYPGLILPTFFLYKFLLGMQNYLHWQWRHRHKHPWHIDTKVSHAEAAHHDELDEEFDEFPTARPPEVARMRYDKLRSLNARIQEIVGDVATHAERGRLVMSWRDPRATVLYLMACLCLAVITFTVPFQAVALLTGFYLMRHPYLRQRLPDMPANFFRRLPCKVDCLL
ncbi:hypothetical protein ABZP36_023423 [Zizania latifolia]